MGKDLFDIQIKGQKIRMVSTIWDLKKNMPRSIGHYAWDGERCRSYPEIPNAKEIFGGGILRGVPTPSFHVGYQMVILEKDAFDIKAPLASVVDKNTWSLSGSETVGNYEAVVIEGPVPGFPGGRLKAWLDPTRGFAPVQMRMFLPIANGQDITEELRDIELMKCNGTWIIKRARVLIDNPNVGQQDVGVYDFFVEDAQIAPELPDSVFVLKFPPGMRVLDTASGVGFLVKEDGTLEPISIVFDAEAEQCESFEPDELPELDGRKNGPSEVTSTSSTEVAAAQDSRDRSARVTDTSAPARYWIWAGLGAVIAGGALIVILRTRRRITR